MKRFLVVTAFLCVIPAFAQSTYTPNLQMQLPNYGQTNWNTILNGDLTIIDSAVGSLQLSFQGNWSSTAVYSKGQMVNYAGALYVSRINSNTVVNTVPGQRLKFIIKQDATGGRTFPQPTVTATGAALPMGAISAVASKTNIQNFIVDSGGTAYFDSPMSVQ